MGFFEEYGWDLILILLMGIALIGTWYGIVAPPTEPFQELMGLISRWIFLSGLLGLIVKNIVSQTRIGNGGR